MPRARTYATDAERQAAYRARKTANQPRRTRHQRSGPRDVSVHVRFTEAEMRDNDRYKYAGETDAAFLRRCRDFVIAHARLSGDPHQETNALPQPLGDNTIRAHIRGARRASRRTDPALEQVIADSLGPQDEWSG